MGSAENTPGKITITPIYWVPTGYALPTDYTGIVNGFISNVAAASGQNSSEFSVLTQYYDQASSTSPPQYLTYSVSASNSVTDTDPFPASGCPVDATDGFSACIDDAQLQAEILSTIEALHLPEGDANFYPVFFPEEVQTCFDSGGSDCSGTSYCGYHSYFQPSDQPIIYANLPFAPVDACASASQAPSGDQSADAIISVLAHETAESMTDWKPGTGWLDVDGYEVGDECAYIFGKSLGSTDSSNPYGTIYDSVINGGRYFIQSLFSNSDYAHGVGEFTDSFGGAQIVPGCVRQMTLTISGLVTPEFGFYVGEATSASLVATGGTWPYTWSVTGGSLPAGLTLDDSTGVISGTPTTAGTSTFTVDVTDSADPADNDEMTLSETVQIFTISTSSLPKASVGRPYSAAVESSEGVGPYAWSITAGALPAGVTIDATTGVISGTPTASGVFPFTVQVTDSITPAQTATASLSITVGVTITTTSLPNGLLHTAYSAPLMATGGNPPYTWKLVSGHPPPGLRLTRSGVIGGEPTRRGTFTFTVEVRDRKMRPRPLTQNRATKVLSITIS